MTMLPLKPVKTGVARRKTAPKNMRGESSNGVGAGLRRAGVRSDAFRRRQRAVHCAREPVAHRRAVERKSDAAE